MAIDETPPTNETETENREAAGASEKHVPHLPGHYSRREESEIKPGIAQFGRIAGIAGLFLFAAGTILYLNQPENQLYWGGALAGGAVLLLAYIAVDVREIKEILSRRSAKYSANQTIFTLIVLGVFIVLNVLGTRHHKRFDLTTGNIHTLSPQTIKVLKELEKDVHVIAFLMQDDRTGATPDSFKLNIERYAYRSPKLTYEIVDPLNEPAKTKQYNVTHAPTIVFKTEDSENRANDVTEDALTNAIIKVTRGETKTICFLSQHGEKALTDTETGGLSQAALALTSKGFQTRSISLLRQKMPADCAAAIIAGPQKRYFPSEVAELENYMNSGGRALVMIDPVNAPTAEDDIEPLNLYLRNSWGVNLFEDFVIDKLSRLFGGDYSIPMAMNYSNHEITKEFMAGNQVVPTFFAMARSVEVASPPPPGIIGSIIAKTSEQSWGETDLGANEVKFDMGIDNQGPRGLIVALTKTITGDAAPPANTPDGEDEPDTEARLVVAGDSDFASNAYFAQASNGDMFMNIVSWLAEEEDLISIAPRKSDSRPMFMTPTQANTAFFLMVVGIPGLLLITGVSVYVGRRRL